MTSPRRAPARGFTLIEAMVTVAILVIVLATAAPSFSAYVQAQAVRRAASDLAESLSLARSEAILRRATVSVAATGGDFANGWQVTVGTTVLRQQAALSNVAFTASTATIAYGLDGRSGTAVTVLVAPPSGSSSTERRCLSTDTTGMPRVRKTASTC